MLIFSEVGDIPSLVSPDVTSAYHGKITAAGPIGLISARGRCFIRKRVVKKFNRVFCIKNAKSNDKY